MKAEFYNEYYDLKDKVTRRIMEVVKEHNGFDNLDVIVLVRPAHYDYYVECRITSINKDVGSFLGISATIGESDQRLEFGLNDMFLIDAIYLLDKIK
jgi:hypothetical protein